MGKEGSRWRKRSKIPGCKRKKMNRVIKGIKACVTEDKKRKILVSILSGILLLLLYGVIFSFSAQDGKKSGSVSTEVAKRCVEVVNVVGRKNWTQASKKAMIQSFEHPVRKTAHFLEYTCMGLLVNILLGQWLPAGKRRYFLTILWIFLSASADEFHQLFVPERSGNFVDVLIDTSGGTFGLLLCILVTKLWRHLHSSPKFSRKNHKSINGC